MSKKTKALFISAGLTIATLAWIAWEERPSGYGPKK